MPPERSSGLGGHRNSKLSALPGPHNSRGRVINLTLLSGLACSSRRTRSASGLAIQPRPSGCKRNPMAGGCPLLRACSREIHKHIQHCVCNVDDPPFGHGCPACCVNFPAPPQLPSPAGRTLRWTRGASRGFPLPPPLYGSSPITSSALSIPVWCSSYSASIAKWQTGATGGTTVATCINPHGISSSANGGSGIRLPFKPAVRVVLRTYTHL